MAEDRGVEWLDTPLGRVRIHDLSQVAGVDQMPFSHKVILENLLRQRHAGEVTQADVDGFLQGRPGHEVPFRPARAFLHDTNGIPLLTDLAAMRDAVAETGLDPSVVDTVVPADLTVDHSVVTDFFDRPDAVRLNVEKEYERNSERYRFLKWGEQAFSGLRVVPPGAGIMHQVNVEYLADVVTVRDGTAFPDTVAGTDSHTTMVNGLSVLAWGVGGIEAEAAMLGEPISMLVPPVVGVELVGRLRPGVTATDLVLTVTELMRRTGVVGKFVEFFGEGVASVSIATRCTIANMSPEFGSTAAMFPIDQATLDFLRFTGRAEGHVGTVEAYARRQRLWHDPDQVAAYDEVLRVDLGHVGPSLAGPRRPQDRVELGDLRGVVRDTVAELAAGRRTAGRRAEDQPDHGAVAIASITSCTNTSNPAVMVAAGLLARNAVRRGLGRKPWVKTSLAPGSRVVTDYLARAGLTSHLDELGFGLVGYGCMTCIGNSGDLVPDLADKVNDEGLVVASVLSGNRNFDGRINNDVSMNFLASPPLVVAYALAGTTDIDLLDEPLGHDHNDTPVYLADLWPDDAEVAAVISRVIDPEMYAKAYATIFEGDDNWRELPAPRGATFAWEKKSTYLRRPPFLDRGRRALARSDDGPPALVDIDAARALLFLGDSVTTDHICPAGRIPAAGAAGRYLAGKGVALRELNSFASRRGDWQVMRRGGFSNPRLRNRLAPEAPGGFTADLTGRADSGRVDEVVAVADRYDAAGVPLIVLAGKEYGTGSSRDWAAKVTALLGVRAVIAESFERIHRSNLVGMGVLPLEFIAGESADHHGLDGTETFSVTGLTGLERSPEKVTVTAVHPVSGESTRFRAKVRLDTIREELYYRSGGLLPHVLDRILAKHAITNPTGSRP